MSTSVSMLTTANAGSKEVGGNKYYASMSKVDSRILMPIVADAVLDLNPEVIYLSPLFLQIAGVADSLQVSKRAKRALDSLLSLIHNPDLVPCIPVLYAFIRDPSGANLRKAISTVLHATFISSINSADLGVLLPLFERALSSPSATQDCLGRPFSLSKT
jgi:hypothetical protein